MEHTHTITGEFAEVIEGQEDKVSALIVEALKGADGDSAGVTITLAYDDDSDVSWMEDESRYLGEAPEDIERYMAEDRERLDAHGNDWWMVGVTVEVRLHKGPWYWEGSASLWGIESDSGADNFSEVVADLLHEATHNMPRKVEDEPKVGMAW